MPICAHLFIKSKILRATTDRCLHDHTTEKNMELETKSMLAATEYKNTKGTEASSVRFISTSHVYIK